MADTSTTLNLSCDLPLVGEAFLSAKIDTNIPPTTPAGVKVPSFNITATVTSQEGDDGDGGVVDNSYAGLKLVRAAKISGTALSNATVTATGFTLPVSPELTLTPYTVPAAPPLTLVAAGTTPRFAFPNPGPAAITVDDIQLNLAATKADGSPITGLAQAQKYPDSDGSLNTFDAPCTIVGDNLLANITVTGGDTPTPITPTPITPTPITPTPITPTPVTPKPVTPTPVTPKPVTPTPVTPKPVTPTPVTPTPGGGGVKYGYNLSGAATLKTLTKGNLPLTGTADATLNVGTGAFSAALVLNQTKGNLVALGFLPVTATVQILPQGDATGLLDPTSGLLTVNTKVRIKLPSVTLFGLQLGGGSGCQAKNISAITLKSPGEFDALDGGSIAGTFSISDLVNCGALTGIISPLTAGNGNAIALKLTPKPTV